MFSKVLIANRGEIACRIARTLRAIGVRSVAVCSQADRGALHTRVADEVRLIGPAEPRLSYLAIEALIDDVGSRVERNRRDRAAVRGSGCTFAKERPAHSAQ